ncbi:MAG: hypothetical protein Q8904_03610 [Bacteroidota bacterium]|nr:hypothetical protein [Bacteroidota bacterium]
MIFFRVQGQVTLQSLYPAREEGVIGFWCVLSKGQGVILSNLRNEGTNRAKKNHSVTLSYKKMFPGELSGAYFLNGL